MAVSLLHKKILPSAFSFNKKMPINKCEFENTIKVTIIKIGNDLFQRQIAWIISFLVSFTDTMKKSN
jgi:hypothetical protein